ncbi:hypothetical protein DOTSEDRAFT_33779 [Dothistroma septosporum NZE10]|uniref:Uncharacterized protein n=1 Tax=Dothistroma septosporum (strain NZE10 / CBS 128990) TaxID=675120 RepID=N1PQJ8_DOTSN|nr:hypothetical protein DOTSEDRAFT_33779 [Dothistroma septosporum NZE10]
MAFPDQSYCSPGDRWIATPYLHNEAHARLSGHTTCADHIPNNEDSSLNAIENVLNNRCVDGWNGLKAGPVLAITFGARSITIDDVFLVHLAGCAAQQRRQQCTPMPVLQRHTGVCNDSNVDIVVVVKETTCSTEHTSTSAGSGRNRGMKQLLRRIGRTLVCFHQQ